MANAGFKGTKVFLDSMRLETVDHQPVLRVGVQFTSEDGDVHAIATHNFVVDKETNDDGLAVAIDAVIRIVTARVERAHYEQPHDAKNQVLTGIAEAFRGTSGAPDEPGTQG